MSIKPSHPEVLSIAETASRLRIARETCRKLIHEGRIESFRLGRQIRIPARVVERLLAGVGGRV